MLLVYVDGRGLVLKRKRRRWLRGLRGLRRASAALLRVDVVVVDLAPSSFVNQSIGEGPARLDQKGPWLEAARGGRATNGTWPPVRIRRPAGRRNVTPSATFAHPHDDPAAAAAAAAAATAGPAGRIQEAGRGEGGKVLTPHRPPSAHRRTRLANHASHASQTTPRDDQYGPLSLCSSAPPLPLAPS
jgi:hypothetical protein